MISHNRLNKVKYLTLNKVKYLTEEYKASVNSFIKCAIKHLEDEENGLIRCPCKNYENKYFKNSTGMRID